MPKSNELPKAPKYGKVLKAIRKQTRIANRLRRRQQEWGKKYYEDAKALNADVIQDLDKIRDFQIKNMTADRKRLEEIYYPLEREQMTEIDEYQERIGDFDKEVKQLKADALAWKTDANMKYMAGKAQANVSQAFSKDIEDSKRALMDAGVNPASAASQALTIGLNTARGAALAAAGTQAADAARQEGDARYMAALQEQKAAGQMASDALRLQGGMVDIGRQYPGQIAAEAGQAATAGAQAVDQTVAITQPRLQSEQIAQGYLGQRLDALRTWTDTLNTRFTNKLDTYRAETDRMTAEAQAEANDSSGLGAIAGIAGGVLQAFVQDGGAIEPISHFDLGGGVNDPNLSGTGGSTGSFYPTGPQAAATRPNTDTVPAKLTPGEFVIPKNVVDWHGQKYFQSLIDKTPKEKQGLIAQTGAVPSIRPDVGALPI